MTDRILIMNSDLQECAELQQSLSSEYEFHTVTSGEHMIERLEDNQESFHAIMIGWTLDDMSGLEVLQTLRFWGIADYVPVIMLTHSEQESITSYGAGVGATIEVPIRVELESVRLRKMISFFDERQTFRANMIKNSKMLSDLTNAFISILMTVMDSYQLESTQHIFRVRHYVSAILRCLSEKSDSDYHLHKENILQISVASMIHDMGELLIDPKKKSLPPDSPEYIIEHTLKGSGAIAQVYHHDDSSASFVRYCYEICRSHHERWNGGGLPDMLNGEQIPLTAQVVALVHEYDDRLTGRFDGKECEPEQAARALVSHSTSSHSPVLIETFRMVTDQLEEIYRKYPEILRESNRV